MAVDVSKIPNNDKFDPVRKALLNLQSQLEEEGQIAYDGQITIDAGTNLTGGGSFTVNQSGNSTITLNADSQTDENFTTALKNKLDGIEAGAEVNTVDSVNTQTGAVVLDADDISDAATTNKFTTQAEIDKLAGIEAGAEVNTVDSVNSQTGAVVLDTDDVQESATPTNKYYTEARFDSSFSNKSTTDLSEGTNLYYTDTRFDNRFATKDTDDLSEGSTNFYYTEARFDASLATKTTDDLTEGTNLYYTDARARAAISDGDGLDYNSTTGVMSHTDTSSQSSVNNSNGVVIQDVSVDQFGHTTSLGSVDLDLRYPQVAFKTIEANTGSEVANSKTDTLAIKGGNLVNTNVTDVSGAATVTVDVSLTDVRFDEDGNKVARGYLYWQGSTVPTISDLPTTSTFNFETNILTINDADWSEVPPTTGYALTTYYVTRYNSTDTGASSTARPVGYSEPQDATGFEGVVTFNSLSDELGASGLTIIDGGRIQTGEISSVGFNAGATATDYSTDGTLISLDSGNIISENFKIIDGNADFRGDFSAATATIGDVEINTTHPNVFDVNLDAYVNRVITDGGTLEAIDNIYIFSDDVNYALYSKNLKIDENGNAAFSGKLRAADGTFTGDLVAATGTFGGELTAATGSFAGELSAATGTFAGALSAATGTFAGSLSAATGSFTGSINVNDKFEVASDGDVTIDGDVLIDANSTISGGVDGSWNIDNQSISVGAKVDDFNNILTDYNSEFGFFGYSPAFGNQRIFLDEKLNYPSGNFSDIVIENDKGDVRVEANNIQFGNQLFDLTSPSFSATSGSIPLLGGLKINWVRRTNVTNQVSGSWASAFTTVFGAIATKGNNSSVYETANNAATVSYTNTNYYLDVNDSNKTVFIIAIGI
jgi:hypothetical protein